MYSLRSMFRAHFHCVLSMAALTCGLSAQPPEEDIRGPKDLVEIPVPQQPPILFWSCVVGGLIVIAIVIILWKTRVRKQHLKSPSQVALTALTELERSSDPLAAEAFANRAAQTVRQYIAAHFGLVAPRRTTEEFLRDLTMAKDSRIIAEGDHLKSFLKSCDLAKFAGSNLNSTQRDELIEAARRFIDATSKPVTP
jgi:Domain of unknown function (DUF4381)